MGEHAPGEIGGALALELFPLVRRVVDENSFRFTEERTTAVAAGDVVNQVFQRDNVDSGVYKFSIDTSGMGASACEPDQALRIE